MKLIKEPTVQFKMLPVCECGYVFRDGIIIYKDIREVNGVKYSEHFIQPWMCPNCQKIIDCVEYNGDITEVKELRG